MRSDREKADEQVIEGPYKELALEVRRMLGYFSDDRPLLSARQAALRSGVNHATISGLVRGARASRDTIKVLAETFGSDESLLLRLAGYAEVQNSIGKSEGTADDLLPSGISQRIFHKIERLSERDLLKLERFLEVWVDDGHEIGS